MSYRSWWIFQDRLNFLIFFGGSSVCLLLTQNYIKEQKLKHAVVDASISHL